MSEVVHIDKDAASEALRSAAFTDEEDGRTTVHSFLGGLGADHDLHTALAYVAEADDIAWVRNIFRHDLAVLVDGRLYHYDAPGPWREGDAA